ncbi:MAG: threonine transporter RhtB [Flavobacteriaceae bacterium]|nr:threonine transporter RhtB [Flavobacteriaceae bacterium]|tara:strand:- start:653 stop:1264 length:612 start_codon:yes stop_codon:yes gene_type:complete
MDFDILFLFIITSISLTLSPGPDILYVLSQSLSYGFKSGFFVSLGLVSGLFFHTAFISLGFGFLISEYPDIFKFIKYFGAFYLIFIGINLILNRNKIKEIKKTQNSLLKNYSTGLIMNLINPKVSLFFLSIFPLFLFDEILNVKIQFLILGIIFIIQSIFVFSLVSLFSSFVGKNIFSIKRNVFFNYFQSTILFLIAFLLILL